MSIDSIKKTIDDLSRCYESSYVRILVGLLPGIDDALMHFRGQRLRAYFDELSGGDIDLTEDEIQKEGFLHAYFATVRAVSRTRRREKIRLFARLFMNYTEAGNFGEDNADIFDEALAILDDLSFREFQILLILHRFEPTSLSHKDENPMELIGKNWDDFLSTIESELEIPSDHISGMLARLNRTGLYETITGSLTGYTGVKGYLTPNFATFINALAMGSDNESC